MTSDPSLADEQLADRTAEKGWVIVRQTVSNGRRWYIARSGLGIFCTENRVKAQVYPTLADAEWVVKLERRDLEMGRGRGGFRVWAEPA